MAKIVEEGVVVLFSRLARDDEETSPMINEDVRSAIETAMNELYGGDGVVVEVREQMPGE